MKRLFTVFALSSALTMAGCVALGLSQEDSEIAYTTAAIAGNAFILSGKATPEATGQLCIADNASYTVLIATRNPADGATYGPADTAHLALQNDGAVLAPSQCNLPSPKS